MAGKGTRAYRLRQGEPERPWWKSALAWYVLGVISALVYYLAARFLFGPL